MKFDFESLKKLKERGLTDDNKIKNVQEERKQKEQRSKVDYSKFDGNDRKGNRSVGYPKNNQSPKSVGTATAPYNFVPLAGKAVSSPLGTYLENGKYGDYIQNEGKFTGYIDIDITTLTPTCINWNSKFFAPNGKPTIPGSTLRGMIKNYLKIISCGTMRAEGNEDLTDGHLYFRGLASHCKTFREHYAEKMTGKFKYTDANGTVQEKNDSLAKAGFLARLEDNSYVVYPADYKAVPYPRIPNPNQKNERDKWLYRVPYELKDDKKGKIKTLKNYVDCHTGAMYGKGHFYRLSNPAWDRPIAVSEEIIADYQEDKSRKGMDLLDKTKSIHKSDFAYGQHFNHLVPCFYLEKDGKVLHFGYGKYYRIPYEKAIGDHIPKDMRDKKIIDFADSMFGCKEIDKTVFKDEESAKKSDCKEGFAGRVFFEDAVCTGEQKLMDAAKPKVLMGPRPTSFQLYLEQNAGVAHWDNDTMLRGYKLYWHQDLSRDDWKLDGKPTKGGDFEGNAPIQPVAKGAKFSGRIRFENLAKEELGALLKVLELGKTGMFKVGMGKPLGMGSVEISNKLHLIDVEQRYTQLFEGEKWKSGEIEADSKAFLNAFNDYMQKKTKEQNIEKQYQHILEVLEIMMSWDDKPSDKQVRYMSIEDDDKPFQNRFVLPTPEEVVKK